MSLEPALRGKTIALIGLMGAGKSSIGRRLAHSLDLPFRDADEEVERAAGRSVSDIFAELGEPAFRAGERRVIARLLTEPPHVLATGGGAFMDPQTRELIARHAVSVWLKADVEVLARRVARKSDRPLLRSGDPAQILRDLAAQALAVRRSGKDAKWLELDSVLDHLAAEPAADHRHVLAHVPDGLLDRAGVRGFDFLALPGL